MMTEIFKSKEHFIDVLKQIEPESVFTMCLNKEQNSYTLYRNYSERINNIEILESHGKLYVTTHEQGGI